MLSHRRKLLPVCIAASLLSGLSMETAAIGVGDIQWQSSLGAPLQAEVPLNNLGDLDATQIKVQLGSQGDYGALGVEYTYLHSQLKIEPIVKNGRGYVRISTREPISEPYLNFVLTLRWPQGQLVREFTVLLDPPTTRAAVASPAQPNPAVTESSATADDAVAAAAPPVPRRHKQRRTPTWTQQAAPAPVQAGADTYLIQRGDSLWRIADKLRPTDVSVEQEMAAIQALNPDAFINGDPNLMKAASTLRLPAGEQAGAIAQTDRFAPNAGAPAAAKNAEKAAPLAAVAADSAAPAAHLVEENSALKVQVAALTDNVSTLNQNLVQSEQRLHQLESQLNELLQQMQEQRTKIAALSGTGDTAAAAQIAQSTGSVINQANAADLRGLPRPHTPWWVHMLYWLGIGGAVTWAIREHFWPQRRLAAAMSGGAVVANGYSLGEAASAPMPRAVNIPAAKARPAEPVLDIEELPDLDLPVDFDAPIRSAAIAETAPQPELLKPADEPVDASISAGVFVAFGRFTEAEHLLRDAIARDQNRIDLKLQLLDVFMQSDQPGAFDDLAAEIEEEARTPETLAELAVLRDSYRTRH